MWRTDWLASSLLAGPDLWKRMSLKCSIAMVFICPLLSWCKISSSFRENSNVVVFKFPFHICMPLVNLWFIHLQGRPLAFDRERILIPGFIRSPPTLAVYDVARALPLGGVGRGFFLHWIWDTKAFLIPLWYFQSVDVKDMESFLLKKKGIVYY